jgi:hypothetical protein
VVVRSDRPACTIEHAWRGVGYGEVALQWWALAIGRADGCTPLSVTFTGRKPRSRGGERQRVPVRTVVIPTVAYGLWVAAVAGLYFAVTCRQGTRANFRSIEPLPGRWAPTQSYGEEGA